MTYTAPLQLTKGATTVNIEVTSLEENLANKMIKIAKPVTRPNQDTVAPSTIIVDLKRIDHQIIIKGWLKTDSVDTAWAKRNNLIGYSPLGILFKSGDLIISLRGQTLYSAVNFDSIRLSDIGDYQDETTTTPSQIGITLTLTKGAIKV